MPKQKRVFDLSKDYIDVTEVMKMYGVTLQTVGHWRTRNGLPFYKFILSDKKNIIRFNKEEVREWAKENEKTPVRRQLL